MTDNTHEATVECVKQYSAAIKHHRDMMLGALASGLVPQVPPVILELESKGGLNILALLQTARFAEMRDGYR